MPLSPTSWWSVIPRFAFLSAAIALAACGGADTGSTTDSIVEDTAVTDAADTSVTSDTAVTDTITPIDVADTVEDTADTTVATDTSVTDTSVEPDTVVATDTVEPTDTEPDTTVVEDVVDDADVAVDKCALAKRGEGCACDDQSQCASDVCAAGPFGSYCTTECSGDGDCDPDTGSTCVIAVGQTKGACVVEEDFLCMPCTADSDCRRAGGDAVCVAEGITGSYCALVCQSGADCPGGFSCFGNKCVPSDGTCDCSDVAVTLQAATTCAQTSTFGTCNGTRTCVGGTLTACSAPIPNNDVCNGLDDDCDTQTDENASACFDNDPCTQDLCGGLAGCSHPAVADAPAVVCNDGDSSTTNDVCVGGLCKGTPTGCTTANAATRCTTPPPGKDLACVTVSCSAQNTCVYTNKAGSCNDGSACTDNDTCAAGACAGTTKSCVDADLCTIDSCDTASGCKHVPNNGACEDGNPCTTGDTCATGLCVGTLLDCSGLDDSCHKGVCNGAGGCFAQALACGVSAIRLHMPSAAFSMKGSGATWFVGSAGHSSPVGTSANTKNKVQFGFHPGMHR